MEAMGWLAWIVIGAVAGWLAGMVMHSGLGLIGDIIVGIIGAFIGGWIFTQFGMPGVTGFNIYTLVVSVVGAVVLLFLVGLVSRRRSRA
jgi:uncharacterized membrane protein YeaQ/YmgE (transglycosylase-associated protein family)